MNDLRRTFPGFGECLQTDERAEEPPDEECD
jgi:hypothetical protein